MKKGTRERGNTKRQKSGLHVVLDTNVYVSVFVYRKRLFDDLWHYAVDGTFELLVSPAIIKELGRVLRRFSWDEKTIAHHYRLIAHVGNIVMPKSVPSVIEDDPADNHILACAEEGSANLIVSGDRHLRRLKTYKGIGIVRPTDFLRMLGGYKR